MYNAEKWAYARSIAFTFNFWKVASALLFGYLGTPSRLALFKFHLILLFSGLTIGASAQENSCRLRISLLTCTPGEALYSTFGHTALRVIDSTTGKDEVFNYGTFQFGPDFYSEFYF